MKKLLWFCTLWLLPFAAIPRTYTGNECDYLGATYHQVVQARDDNLPLAELQARLERWIASTRTSTHPIPESDDQMFLDIAAWLYVHPEIDADHATLLVYHACKEDRLDKLVSKKQNLEPLPHPQMKTI